MSNKLETIMRQAAESIPCLEDWNIGELLGQGTVGTVFLSCKPKVRRKKCGAAKIQKLQTDEDVAQFEREVKSQKAFAPFAPKIFVDCQFEDEDGQRYGVILMELVGSTLDEYLVEERTPKELNKVRKDLEKILKFLRKKKLTHGDLALFNIGFRDKDLILIDFDRSAVDMFNPQVEFYRLQTEMYPSTRSEGTAEVEEKNMQYLQKNGLENWAQAAGIKPKKTSIEADQAWEEAYNTYCVEADVKCLADYFLKSIF